MRSFDLFCGGGGSSAGAQSAGVEIAGGLDVDSSATATFRANFPKAVTVESHAETVDLAALKKRVGPIDLLLASPECTNHTHARGSRETSEASRMTAFQVLRYADVLAPRWIIVENVVNMRPWSRYSEWLEELRANYYTREVVLNSQEFGVPQSRRRLFILCDALVEPPMIEPLVSTQRSAAEIIDLNGSSSWAPLRLEGRAKNTIDRADRAIDELGSDLPFLLVYYGTDRAGGWQRVDSPLRTVTTIDRFAIVRPVSGGHEMRMLSVPELRLAMGFDSEYLLAGRTRRENVRLLGNAVCPPVMQAVVAQLTDAGSPHG